MTRHVPNLELEAVTIPVSGLTENDVAFFATLARDEEVLDAELRLAVAADDAPRILAAGRKLCGLEPMEESSAA